MTKHERVCSIWVLCCNWYLLFFPVVNYTILIAHLRGIMAGNYFQVIISLHSTLILFISFDLDCWSKCRFHTKPIHRPIRRRNSFDYDGNLKRKGKHSDDFRPWVLKIMLYRVSEEINIPTFVGYSILVNVRMKNLYIITTLSTYILIIRPSRIYVAWNEF